MAIKGIEPLFVELFRLIPRAARPDGNAEAEQRLFTKPTSESDPNFLEEWGAFVTPDLRHLFQTANEVVTEDLRQLDNSHEGEVPELKDLVIPAKRLDHWLSSLNQARLVLAARNNFSDREMDSEFPELIKTERELHLLQIQFYGYLQEKILEQFT